MDEPRRGSLSGGTAMIEVIAILCIILGICGLFFFMGMAVGIIIEEGSSIIFLIGALGLLLLLAGLGLVGHLT